MASFAIWMKQKNEGEGDRCGIKVHFNCWYAYEAKKNKGMAQPILDIGIMLEDASIIEHLYVYVPFPLSTNEISDLGIVLNNNVTLNAVFNDNYRIINSSAGKAFLVSDEDLSEKDRNKCDCFIVYELDFENGKKDASLETAGKGKNKGTTICINVADLVDLKDEMKNQKCNRSYFRFRLSTPYLDGSMVRQRGHDPLDMLFHDVLSVTKVMECRLNHSRSLSSSLRDEIRSCGGLPDILRLDFFLITDETVDLLNDNAATVRRLERDVWSKYLPMGNECGGKDQFSNAIAYHWKKVAEQSFKDWDLYAKISFLYRNNKIIFIYVVMLLVVCIVGNVLYSLLGLACSLFSS